MELTACIDDLREILFNNFLLIIGEIYVLIILSWDKTAIILFFMLDIFSLCYDVVDWLYLGRRIVLDEVGCTFISGKRKKRFTWQEMNVQYVDELSVLFADCEIPGDGIIISANPISKSTYIGAMTYCKFTHPSTSIFIRFSSPSDSIKKTSAKFVYQGFCATKSELMVLLDAAGVVLHNLR